LVEVDSNYYAMPLPPNTQQWAERTPDHFVFNVKAFRLFTGLQTQPRIFPKALGLPITQNVCYRDVPEQIQKELWGRFFQALEPLHAAGSWREALSIRALDCLRRRASPPRRALRPSDGRHAELWTLKRMRAVIERLYGVRFTARSRASRSWSSCRPCARSSSEGC
jgi:hypothetical protein